MNKCKLFYSYSHKDEEFRIELEKHLSIFKRQELISEWHDRNISAGDEWENKIDVNIKQADVILLLISSDFIASDYCYDKEVKLAIERHEKGEARVIPIIIRHVNWEDAPFGKLQALPLDGKPVKSWEDQDEAFKNITIGIRNIIKELKPNQNNIIQDIAPMKLLEKFKARPKKYNRKVVTINISLMDGIHAISSEDSSCLGLPLGDSIYRSFKIKTDKKLSIPEKLYASDKEADILEELEGGDYEAEIQFLFGIHEQTYQNPFGEPETERESILAYKLINIKSLKNKS